MLAEEEKAEPSALVQARLTETQTLTVITSDEAFESAGKGLVVFAQLRTRLEAALRPYIEFWHRGHEAHTELLATLDGSFEAGERSMKQGSARYERRKEEARRRQERPNESRLKSSGENWKTKIASAGKRKLNRKRQRQEDEVLAEAARPEAEGDHETAELTLERSLEENMKAPQLRTSRQRADGPGCATRCAEGARRRISRGSEERGTVWAGMRRESEFRRLRFHSLRIFGARSQARSGAGQRLRNKSQHPRHRRMDGLLRSQWRRGLFSSPCSYRVSSSGGRQQLGPSPLGQPKVPLSQVTSAAHSLDAGPSPAGDRVTSRKNAPSALRRVRWVTRTARPLRCDAPPSTATVRAWRPGVARDSSRESHRCRIFSLRPFCWAN